MSNMSKVSVIIPVYNTDQYFDSCLKSIIDQTYTNLDIIIIDDGSTDNTNTICKKYAQIDNRISFYHKTNGGVSSARNLGIEKATGTYITFIDSDDIISEDTIELLVRGLEKADVSMIAQATVPKASAVYQDVRTNKTVYYDRADAVKRLAYANGIDNSICGLIYDKRAIGKLQFDENIAYGEDYDFKLRLFMKAVAVAANSRAGYYYVKRSDSAMNKRFNEKRADSLAVALNNLQYICDNVPELQKAARHRVFLEALSVLQSLEDKKKFSNIFNQCCHALSKYRFGVITDNDAPFQHRVYAITSIVSIPLLLKVLNVKNKMLRR